MDPTKPETVSKPPTETVVNSAMVIKVIGAFLEILSYGFKDASANHPDVIAALGDWTDWTAIFGLFALAGGIFMSWQNTRKAKTALAFQAVETEKKIEAEKTTAVVQKADAEKQIAIAKCSPPCDENGEMSAHHTATHAAAQAMHDGNFAFARDIMAAMEKDTANAKK